MRILAIIQKYNNKFEPDYNYMLPSGLAYVIAVLRQANYEVDCLNMNHEEGILEHIIEQKLDEIDYDVVLLTGVALDYKNIDLIIKTIRDWKPEIKIILGGLIITTETELMFNALKPDFGIIGDGEIAILELLKDLTIPNQVYKSNADLDINELPFPDYDCMGIKELLNNTNTNTSLTSMITRTEKPGIYTLIASRNCPYNCTFCYHSGKYQQRSIENIMAEIREVINKYDINIIQIQDDCFAITKERVLEFCKQMKQLRAEIPIDHELYWTCLFTVKMADKQLFKVMKESGCEMVNFGLESYNQDVLNSMKKRQTPQEIDKAIKTLFEAKLAMQSAFIFGDMAETTETYKQTLQYYKKNCFGQITLTLIQPYPESEIWKYCLRNGLITNKLEFIKNNMSKAELNMTLKMTPKQFNKMKQDINNTIKTQLRKVIPTRVSGAEVKVTCPFCQTENNYLHCKINHKLNFAFYGMCRDCHKQFLIVSKLQKFVLENAPELVPIYQRMRKWIQ